jgi:hypothetical protein
VGVVGRKLNGEGNENRKLNPDVCSIDLISTVESLPHWRSRIRERLPLSNNSTTETGYC